MMKTLMFRLCTFLLLVTAVGCGDTDPPSADAGTADADMGASPGRVLEIHSDTFIPLMTGETADIEVRLHDDEGQSVTNTRLEFALVGTANDSSLNRIEGLTDGGGRAGATIVAGIAAGMFRIRISAEGAAAVYVGVSVSDRGFGNLEVEPVYEGERPGVLAVAIVSGALCSDHDLLNDRSRYIRLAEGARTLRFEGIPVGVPVAVVGRLDARGGGDDIPLARGCVDGTMVSEDETSNVTVPIDDAPLVTSGAYQTALEIDTSMFSDEASATLESIIIEHARDGSALLDLLEEHLISDGATDALQALMRARGERDLDASYSRELAAAWSGPERLTAALNVVMSELDSITVTAELRIGESAMMATDGLESGGSPLNRDTVGAAIELRSELAPDGGALDVSLLAAHIAGGDLITAVLLRTAELADFMSVREWVGSQLDCTTLPSPLEASCDSACVQAVCEAHLAQLTERFVTTTAEFNMSWPRLEFSGSVLFSDEDGDRFPDSVQADFLGHWGESEISAVLTGSRILADI